jgi:hypothetical protein
MVLKSAVLANPLSVRLQLSVKSDHPNIDTTILLQEIEKEKAKLRKHLASSARIKKLSIERRGTLPIGIETAVITVLIEIAKELGKDTAKILASEAFDWMKSRWKDATFKRVSTSRKSRAKKKIKKGKGNRA